MWGCCNSLFIWLRSHRDTGSQAALHEEFQWFIIVGKCVSKWPCRGVVPKFFLYIYIYKSRTISVVLFPIPFPMSEQDIIQACKQVNNGWKPVSQIAFYLQNANWSPMNPYWLFSNVYLGDLLKGHSGRLLLWHTEATVTPYISNMGARAKSSVTSWRKPAHRQRVHHLPFPSPTLHRCELLCFSSSPAGGWSHRASAWVPADESQVRQTLTLMTSWLVRDGRAPEGRNRRHWKDCCSGRKSIQSCGGWCGVGVWRITRSRRQQAHPYRPHR